MLSLYILLIIIFIIALIIFYLIRLKYLSSTQKKSVDIIKNPWSIVKQSIQIDINETIRNILSSKDKDNILRKLEEELISYDIDHKTVMQCIEYIKNTKKIENNTLKDGVSGYFLTLFKDNEYQIELSQDKDISTYLIVGINGTGKTTTVGKLANYLSQNNIKTIVGACDTFRAAATAQLKELTSKIDIECVMPVKEKQDPASVAYKTVQECQKNGYKVAIIDTAGRLHTDTNLMLELKKIDKVIQKLTNITERLLIIDASTGQNGLKQIKEFVKQIDITGVIITKMDGEAKGGIIITIQQSLNLPIKFVCTGENLDDIIKFNYNDYVNSLI